jgi:3-methyladenine DNA glycosylase AlkC
MAEPLKLFFDRALVGRIADSIAAAHPGFARRSFVRDATDGLDELELKDRAKKISDAMASHLPEDFADAARVLTASLGAKHKSDELEGAGMEPFFYLPHTMFVAERGLDHFDVSMALQHELTQRFTCEFSIRSFLDRHPEATLARLAEWTTDPSPHVRRLVSEGTRQRLPWAPRVRLLDDHPERALALIEALRDDPSTLVRRSVANHLNDLTKSRPELAFAVCERWLEDATVERRKLVEHALRSAVKRADKRALALLGHGEKPKVKVEDVRFSPARVAIGESVRVALSVRSTASAPQSLNLDLAVDFVKLRGVSTKVFKLRRVELGPKATLELDKSVSLAVHTTRTPNVGRHAVALLVNGTRVELGAFDVVAAKRRA